MSTREILQGNTLLPLSGAKTYSEEVVKLCKGEKLQVIPEPTNNFDTNALRVITSGGKTVGYIPAAIAARIVRDIGQVPMVASVVELTQNSGIQVGARLKIQAILDFAG
jgi:hypothetical protein